MTAVVTDRATVECETVVLAAGLWTRELGRRCGVDVPLQAAEHYYLLTEPVPGVHRDLPVVEDPDRYGYYREEADGLLVGLFEPVGAAWHLDGPPADFAFGTIPPDWDRMTPYLEDAMWRYPGLEGIGLRKFFCGPESFTADVHPLLGPAPEVEGVFVAAGMNSLGILSGGGVGQPGRPVDRRRPPAGRRHALLGRARAPARDHPEVPGRAGGRVARRAVRRRRLADLPVEQRRAAYDGRCCTTGWPRPARGSGSRPGWEYPLWFGEPGTTSGRRRPGAGPRRSRTSPRSTAPCARRSA